MEVQAFTMNQVFLRNRTLKIPFFQRGYVWEEKNWQQFFDDIAAIARVPEGETPEIYFLGSIIYKKRENTEEIYDVIDGQQRLTTIVMFMKALCLAINRGDLFKEMFMKLQTDLLAKSEPILVPNYNDKAVYDQILNLEVLRQEPIVKDSRLADAFAYFAKRIVEARDPQDDSAPISLTNLFKAFTGYVKVVAIEVGPGENAQKIFETINCAGIKLTTGEMLKNFLFDESMISSYERSWKKVFEQTNRDYWENEMVNGRTKGSHTENFFYRYMLIKMQEDGVKGLVDAKAYRQKDGLYEKFCNLFRKAKISKEDAVSEIVSYAQLYMDTFKADTLNEPAVAYGGIERLAYLMFLQDSWTMTPYVLYILRSVQSESERNKIFQYMENYLMRRIICKSKNNNYSDMFSENLIGQKVCTYSAFKEYVNDENARGALLMPSDKDVVEAVKHNDLKTMADTVLYMLESKINKHFDSSQHDNAANALMKEQIMPEKLHANWGIGAGYDEESRLALTKTLGNFTFLREKMKSKLKNAKWDTKALAMKDLVIDLDTCQYVRSPEWNEKCIESRNEWLAGLILKAWAK